MEVIFETVATYTVILIFIGIVLFFYLRKKRRESTSVQGKIEKAKEFGLYEPVSLHPVINYDICIGSGACVTACPEEDVLGLVNGKATTINASRCVGHGACFHACPLQAITLVIGTEKRGVDLPHVSQEFETNIPGIYIAGELGGMGLIKNAVEQGKQAVENITKKIKKNNKTEYDLIIIGAGPAGISATLEAKRNNLRSITLEQDSLGGTVYTFPRSKIVMTSPMELPTYGKVKFTETTKSELLNLWNEVLTKNNIVIQENEKVLEVVRKPDLIEVTTSKKKYTTSSALLAIGRRGSPRKLGVLGETKEKVAYRLLEPEHLHKKNIIVVGGGDSAIESALLLAAESNNVYLSYRGDAFQRVKPRNLERLNSAVKNNKIKLLLNSNLLEIKDNSVILKVEGEETPREIGNDLVYIFAGGELPNKFLEKVGITITKKFGVALLKHS